MAVAASPSLRCGWASRAASLLAKPDVATCLVWVPSLLVLKTADNLIVRR